MSSPNNRDIPSMRLDKFVSHGAGLSRTDVKRLLRRDEITVDGIAIRDPAHQINPQQKVMLNGEPVHWPTHRQWTDQTTLGRSAAQCGPS